MVDYYRQHGVNLTQLPQLATTYPDAIDPMKSSSEDEDEDGHHL